MADPDSLERAWAAELRRGWLGDPQRSSYQLTAFVFLRALGLVYYVAFVSLAVDLPGLLGSRGILPVGPFLARVQQHFGLGAALWKLPSLFWLNHDDWLLQACAWLGVGLSLLVVAGYANAFVLALLWLTYSSFVHVGQVFFGYGWEMLLLETGFLAVFLLPPFEGHPTAARPPRTLIIVLLRWLAFRVMFGAGLIKIRGDDCWTDLSCLVYHYETQPNPHPLSWLLHQAPDWFHRFGVLFNHFVELIVPWGYFGPRRIRHLAGALTIAFQTLLIASGNLSFLNWLTIVVVLACFDDRLVARFLPRRIGQALAEAPRVVAGRARRAADIALGVLVALLSMNPLANMLSTRQRMNASFDPLHLVNTYGAFGSVGKVRYEVVLEGTRDDEPNSASVWLPYEFPCKPGDVNRRPCLITPFHRRLDWQMWFAALGSHESQPWIVSLVYHLLRGDAEVLALLDKDPFGAETPARHVRARLYRYRFTTFSEQGWYRRDFVDEYLEPLSLDHPEFRNYLRRHGWL